MLGFCTRCLRVPAPPNAIAEHHIHGRTPRPEETLLVCDECHAALDGLQRDDANAYVAETAAIREKTRLLVASPSLLWVVEHRDLVVQGFMQGNRHAPRSSIGPQGVEYSGLFGAVGKSGRRYYFVAVQPGQPADGAVDVVDPTDDGVRGAVPGGPTSGGWIRFRGSDGGVLNAFINAHARQVLPTEDLSPLRQA
jgi:hypothetical protein